MRLLVKQSLEAERSKPIQAGLWRVTQKSKVVEPRSNQLQLDIDGMAQALLFQTQLATFHQNGISKGWRVNIKQSRRPGHLHVTITMPRDWARKLIPVRMHMLSGGIAKKLETLLRVGLAAILGDDLRRSCYNWCRVVNGDRYPIVFFERRHDGKPSSNRSRKEKKAARAKS